jgi:hypothetical protein
VNQTFFGTYCGSLEQLFLQACSEVETILPEGRPQELLPVKGNGNRNVFGHRTSSWNASIVEAKISGTRFLPSREVSEEPIPQWGI